MGVKGLWCFYFQRQSAILAPFIVGSFRAASSELVCRGCSLLFWKSRPLDSFQVGRKGVGCSAIAEKCSPGRQTCVVPRGSPGCLILPLLAQQHPRNQGPPSPTSSDGTQFLHCSSPCVPCRMHSGLGWAGMGGCRMEPGVGGQGRS